MKIEKKISVLSRFFRFLAVVGMVEIIRDGVTPWIATPYSVFLLPKMNMLFVSASLKDQIPLLSEMPTSLKVVGILAYFTPIVAKALICVFLVILFTEYKRWSIFSKKALDSIRNIGYVILGATLLSLTYSFITYYLLPNSFPIMNRKLQGIMIYGPIGYSLNFILSGLFIIFISWVMSVGKKLEDEQRYTV